MSMNQVIKAAQAFSHSKTAALKKSLAAERKDKEELKRLNQQLIGEVQQLQRQLQDAKDQHQEWRLKYSAALSEKIDLLRPHEPNPVLPIEVFAIIAGFAAGANDYAGVAAMCATLAIDAGGTQADIIRDGHLESGSPGASARFAESVGCARVSAYQEESLSESPSSHRTGMVAPVGTTSTLSTGLFCRGTYPARHYPRHPIFDSSPIGFFGVTRPVTRDEDPHGVYRASISQQVRRSVWDILLRHLACSSDCRDSNLTVNVQKDAKPGHIETSMDAIRQWILSPRSATDLLDINLVVPGMFVMPFWVNQLREWLNLKPDLTIHVRIPSDRPDPQHYLNAMRDFQEMYKTLWRDDFPRFRTRGDGQESAFFKLCNLPSDPDLCRSIQVAFSRHQGFDGFAVSVVDHPPQVQLINGARHLLRNIVPRGLVFERHALDGTVLPWANDESSDDDSDGDTSTDSSDRSCRSPFRNIPAGSLTSSSDSSSSSDLSDITSSDDSSSDEED